MRLRSLFCSALLAGSASALLAAPPADPSDLKAKFNVSEQTQIPGITLKPGAYSIRVVDHLTDRYIVRVDGPSNQHTTFIGLPSSSLPKASGMINFGTGPEGAAAARGFGFPGGTSVEFVYPKAEAVSLAKLNSSKVVAIDPASEGKAPGSTGDLSKEDMEVVTLWTLSATKVGTEDPTIKAERYQQTASLHKPAAPRAPVIAKLPHTASRLPLLALLALVSLAGAAGLRLFRTAALTAR